MKFTNTFIAATMAMLAPAGIPSVMAQGPCGPNIQLKYSQSFSWIYDDTNTGANGGMLYAYRVNTESGWYRLGDTGNHNGRTPTTSDGKGVLIQAPGDILRAPTGYTWVWDDTGTGGAHDGSFWKPVPPAGYTCLGHVISGSHSKPSTDLIRCVKNNYVVGATTTHFWADHGSGGRHDGDVWRVIPKSGTLGTQIDTLYTQGSYGTPSDSVVHTLNQACIDGMGFPTATPTHAPTHTPTKAPTPPPTVATELPTDSPTLTPTPPPTPLKGSSLGDPHFKTWSGEKYDFHGECDLILLDNPKYADGLGMSIHIRTKIDTWWSYIEAAVLRIGDHRIELKGSKDGEDPQYWINGIPGQGSIGDDPEIKKVEAHLGDTFKGFKIHYKRVSSKQHKIRIDLNVFGDAISMGSFNDWISVNVKAANSTSFEGAKGLMGVYPTGAFASRDGETIIDDRNQFGVEWQVNESETVLFHDAAGVQAPATCTMPLLDASASRKLRRRLGESLLTTEAATAACAHVDPDDLDACVYDVMAKNDVDMAGAY